MEVSRAVGCLQDKLRAECEEAGDRTMGREQKEEGAMWLLEVQTTCVNKRECKAVTEFTVSPEILHRA